MGESRLSQSISHTYLAHANFFVERGIFVKGRPKYFFYKMSIYFSAPQLKFSKSSSPLPTTHIHISNSQVLASSPTASTCLKRVHASFKGDWYWMNSWSPFHWFKACTPSLIEWILVRITQSKVRKISILLWFFLYVFVKVWYLYVYTITLPNWGLMKLDINTWLWMPWFAFCKLKRKVNQEDDYI